MDARAAADSGSYLSTCRTELREVTDRSGYCWLPHLPGERCTDQASAETLRNDRTGLGGRVGLLHLRGHDPDHHTVEMQLWGFDAEALKSAVLQDGARRDCKVLLL